MALQNVAHGDTWKMGISQGNCSPSPSRGFWVGCSVMGTNASPAPPHHLGTVFFFSLKRWLSFWKEPNDQFKSCSVVLFSFLLNKSQIKTGRAEC